MSVDNKLVAYTRTPTHTWNTPLETQVSAAEIQKTHLFILDFCGHNGAFDNYELLMVATGRPTQKEIIS